MSAGPPSGDVIVFGASRGLGAAIAEGAAEPGETVWCASRTRPACVDRVDGVDRRWIRLDLSDPAAVAAAAAAVGDRPVALLVYNAGVWEQAGFEAASEAEIRGVVDINLTSMLLAVQRFLPNLRRAPAARVVLIGSTCGLENEGSASVAYVATKFAVRGVAHGLREVLRPAGVPVTAISPGSMATDIPLSAGPGEALRVHDGARMPVADIVEIIRLLRRLSPAACAKEIHLPAIGDDDV